MLFATMRGMALFVPRVKYHLVSKLLVQISDLLIPLRTVVSGSSLFRDLRALINVVFSWPPSFTSLNSHTPAVLTLQMERT